MSFTFFILLTSISITTWLTYSYIDQRTFAHRHGCQKPTAASPAHPLLGGTDYLLARIRSVTRHRFADGIRDLFARLGDTFVVHIMGLPIIHTIDPANLRAIMSTSASNYAVLPQRDALVSTIFGRGILAASGTHWQHSRSAVRAGLAKFALDDAPFLRHADAMVADICARPPGDLFDFSPHVNRYLLDLSTELYFGDSTRAAPASPAHTRATAFSTNFRHLAQIARAVTLAGAAIPLAVHALYGASYRRAKAAVESLVDTYLSTPRNHTLASSLSATTPSTHAARTEILNLLLAGTDTVGINLCEPLLLLAQHPAAYAELRTAVRAAIGDRPPSLADLRRIPALRHVLAESARLRPTLAVHGRIAARHTVLPRGGGPSGADPIMVPRGSYILYSTHALHRQKDVFGGDADAFRPARWQHVAPGRFEYLPFGGGARACPGEKIGWTMVAFALCRVVQRFERVECADRRPWSEATAFSFHNRFGVWVRVSPGDGDVDEAVEARGGHDTRENALVDEGYASGHEERSECAVVVG